MPKQREEVINKINTMLMQDCENNLTMMWEVIALVAMGIWFLLQAAKVPKCITAQKLLEHHSKYAPAVDDV